MLSWSVFLHCQKDVLRCSWQIWCAYCCWFSWVFGQLSCLNCRRYYRIGPSQLQACCSLCGLSWLPYVGYWFGCPWQGLSAHPWPGWCCCPKIGSHICLVDVVFVWYAGAVQSYVTCGVHVYWRPVAPVGGQYILSCCLVWGHWSERVCHMQYALWYC